MEDLQMPCEDSPSLGKSFSFYSPSDSGLNALNSKRSDHVAMNMFADSLPLHAFQKSENLKDVSVHPSDVTRKIDAFFEDFSVNHTTNNPHFGSNGNLDSIITSMNHLGLSSASVDHLPAGMSRIDSFRNIWKNDTPALQSFSQPSTNQQLAEPSYSVNNLQQQQQQKYLYNLMAMKNLRTASNGHMNGGYDVQQRTWDENMQRTNMTKSFPSQLNNQFARQNASIQHSNVDMPHIVLKSRSNMPFPKHLLPYTVNGVRNVMANVEDEDHHGLNNTSLDQDLTAESLNSSLFNNGWMHSNALTRLPHNELDLNLQLRDQVVPNVMSTNHLLRLNSIHQRMEQYSRKVFVGGLPPDIDDREIMTSFERFGSLVVDWPHKAEMRSYFPPKGYCFLLFQEEMSVKLLIDTCILDDGKLYCHVSSPTIRNKLVQIRPWKLMDADYVMDNSQPLDPRKTIFVGGVPRPLKAAELAQIIDRLYGGVCYAGIDIDPDLKYPKGAGRVAFSNQQSYIAAISARFVQLQHGDIDKRVEVKPYVLDDQLCDECQGVHSVEKFAPYFCANVTCLQYYCEKCWYIIHSRPGREFHKPLIKEGADRPRVLPFRW